jgi:hypothetical protein
VSGVGCRVSGVGCRVSGVGPATARRLYGAWRFCGSCTQPLNNLFENQESIVPPGLISFLLSVPGIPLRSMPG